MAYEIFVRENTTITILGGPEQERLFPELVALRDEQRNRPREVRHLIICDARCGSAEVRWSTEGDPVDFPGWHHEYVSLAQGRSEIFLTDDTDITTALILPDLQRDLCPNCAGEDHG